MLQSSFRLWVADEGHRPAVVGVVWPNSTPTFVTAVTSLDSDEGKHRPPAVTSQVPLDSYANAGVECAAELVNALTVQRAYGKPVQSQPLLPAIAHCLAVDPPSVAQLSESDVPGFVRLAHQLRAVFEQLHQGHVDAAAAELNLLLLAHPAHPYLAKENGQWRLHHHPLDAALVPMWTSICAEGLARLVGSDYADRFGLCDAAACERVFVDVSKNARRRFCSTLCQSRAKAALFRARQRAETSAGPEQPAAVQSNR